MKMGSVRSMKTPPTNQEENQGLAPSLRSSKIRRGRQTSKMNK